MKTALLVIDMQKVFGEMVDRPLPHIKLLSDFFNDTDRLVVFTQHGHQPDEFIPPIKNQLIRKVSPENAIRVNTQTGSWYQKSGNWLAMLPPWARTLTMLSCILSWKRC